MRIYRTVKNIFSFRTAARRDRRRRAGRIGFHRCEILLI